MSSDAIGKESREKVLDLRAVLGVVARVTTPTEVTGGEYVEMDVTADPGAQNMVHIHPEMDETFHVTSGTLDVLYGGRWRSLGPGETFSVPRGEVHAFRNQTDQPTRFVNRHVPALGFQAFLETVDRLVREGKVRGTKDFRSGIHLSMAQDRYRADKVVKPPQAFFTVMAWIGRRLGYSID
jgi:quercetin dioxygenase-like cupin family protein